MQMEPIGLLVDTRIGQYTMVSAISSGQYGEVWRAYDNDTQRFVAIKFFTESENAKIVFSIEVAAYQKIQSQDVSICDLVVCPIEYAQTNFNGQQRYFIVLELVNFFVDLKKLVMESMHLFRTPPKTVLSYTNIKYQVYFQLATNVARSINALHEAGVVHRDLHSSNVLITEREDTKLVDPDFWRLMFGEKGLIPENILETRLERYLRLRPTVRRLSDKVPESDIVREIGNVTAKLIDFNFSVVDDGNPKNGSVRDPTLREGPYTFEECKLTDVWDFGLILFEIAWGQSIFRNAYLPIAWTNAQPVELVSVVEPTQENIENTKRELFENAIRSNDVGEIMRRIGSAFTGGINLPTPFEQFSDTLSFDYRERPTMEQVVARLEDIVG